MTEIVKICKLHGQLVLSQTTPHFRKRIRKRTGETYLSKQYDCKKCSQFKTNEWRKRNLIKVAESERKKRSHPEFVKKCRIGFLRRKYGITINEYQKMLNEQNSVCAICKKEDMTIEANSLRLKGLCIDHCHLTNKIRGLLCNKCNPMIGYSQDDPEILEKAAQYLRFHSKA